MEFLCEEALRRNRTRLLPVGPWVFLATAVGLAAERYEVTLERGVAVKMRDGTVLRADIYRPKAEGKFPLLLQRTPYDKRTGVDFGPKGAARRLRDHGLFARTVGLKLRYANFYTLTRDLTLDEPTHLDSVIFENVLPLFESTWNRRQKFDCSASARQTWNGRCFSPICLERPKKRDSSASPRPPTRSVPASASTPSSWLARARQEKVTQHSLFKWCASSRFPICGLEKVEKPQGRKADLALQFYSGRD